MFLNSACTDNRNLNNNIRQNEITQPKVTDTLKFRTGIRSILQDSKGNFWFGSDQEGVCKYDGITFTYYTTENGFCGKQVICIREDETGLVWFGTSSGLCCFDGTKFTTDGTGSPLNNLDDKHYAAWHLSTSDLWFPGINKNELIRIDKGKSYTIKYPVQIPRREILLTMELPVFQKVKMEVCVLLIIRESATMMEKRFNLSTIAQCVMMESQSICT